jgi:hypothetical protein
LQGLSKLIGDNAPAAVKAQKFENFFGRKLAVDASMCMYQFLVRSHNPDARCKLFYILRCSAARHCFRATSSATCLFFSLAVCSTIQHGHHAK